MNNPELIAEARKALEQHDRVHSNVSDRPPATRGVAASLRSLLGALAEHEAAPSDTDRGRLDAIHELLSSLDLNGTTTREGTAWGSILREAKELSRTAQPVQVEPKVEEWKAAVIAERTRHPKRGYTAEHDREHGLQHLANWAIDYARCGKGVKSSSMVLALLEAAESVQVEVTDEMVEKAMVAVIRSADIPTGMRATLLGATPTIRELVDLDDVVRVVLEAALGGGGGGE